MKRKTRRATPARGGSCVVCDDSVFVRLGETPFDSPDYEDYPSCSKVDGQPSDHLDSSGGWCYGCGEYDHMTETKPCQKCGCWDLDACFDEDLGPCWWVGEDDLCSHCSSDIRAKLAAWKEGDDGSDKAG